MIQKTFWASLIGHLPWSHQISYLTSLMLISFSAQISFDRFNNFWIAFWDWIYFRISSPWLTRLQPCILIRKFWQKFWRYWVECSTFDCEYKMYFKNFNIFTVCCCDKDTWLMLNLVQTFFCAKINIFLDQSTLLVLNQNIPLLATWWRWCCHEEKTRAVELKILGCHTFNGWSLSRLFVTKSLDISILSWIKVHLFWATWW